jgi:hypothetical protein
MLQFKLFHGIIVACVQLFSIMIMLLDRHMQQKRNPAQQAFDVIHSIPVHILKEGLHFILKLEHHESSIPSCCPLFFCCFLFLSTHAQSDSRQHNVHSSSSTDNFLPSSLHLRPAGTTVLVVAVDAHTGVPAGLAPLAPPAGLGTAQGAAAGGGGGDGGDNMSCMCWCSVLPLTHLLTHSPFLSLSLSLSPLPLSMFSYFFNTHSTALLAKPVCSITQTNIIACPNSLICRCQGMAALW